MQPALFILHRKAVWIPLTGILVALFILLIVKLLGPPSVAVLTGVVIRAEPDARRQVPIDRVEVSTADNLSEGSTFSQENGLFRLQLRRGVFRGEKVWLRFRHPDYRPQDIPATAGSTLYVVRLIPLWREPADTGSTANAIANIRIRYSVHRKTSVNEGSATKVFEVKNSANIPCRGQSPCSPDHKWKASIGGATLDAGENNEFEDARVSCVAGPCPFTKIETDHFSTGGRVISVEMRNWSDTATFLFEAEVKRTMRTEDLRQSYPTIFGDTMSFSLPDGAQGLSIQADVEGSDIVFPIGPALHLSWAACTAKDAVDRSKLIRCELKPGYRFASQ